MKHVLFLCSGNYYRSRFAEVLFNHLARQRGLAWQADSCGLRVKPDGVVNVGPISRHALAEMAARALPPGPERFPRQVCAADLRDADLVIAMKEAEHRAMVQALFPEWTDRVEYWHVHDLDVAMPGESMAELEQLVRGLVDRLAGAAG